MSAYAICKLYSLSQSFTIGFRICDPCTLYLTYMDDKLADSGNSEGLNWVVLDVRTKTPRWVECRNKKRFSSLKYPSKVNDVVLFGFMVASFLADFRVNRVMMNLLCLCS